MFSILSPLSRSPPLTSCMMCQANWNTSSGYERSRLPHYPNQPRTSLSIRIFGLRILTIPHSTLLLYFFSNNNNYSNHQAYGLFPVQLLTKIGYVADFSWVYFIKLCGMYAKRLERFQQQSTPTTNYYY
jgi:hypothetical protein